MGQAFHASRLGDEWLELVLGPNIELLVWIPKQGDALDVDQQRPLMLPTTLRRLCEAVTVAV
eukprot:8336812-Alexandrium_andersonii.AAC.1